MTEYYTTPDMQTRLKRLSGCKVAQIEKNYDFQRTESSQTWEMWSRH